MHEEKEKKIILENPFHPLDLSAHDLLTVYKRFQHSGQVNRNPTQQLPIQTIAQLIASLKGSKPSSIQKCMSQALIKTTISWNEFLAFLDQQSQVRHKILDWLLYEKAIIRYKFKSEYPFRHSILHHYDTITNMNFIEFGQDSFMLTVVDYRKIILIDMTDDKFEEIDRFVQKNISRKVLQSEKCQSQIKQKHGLLRPNESKIYRKMSKSFVRTQRTLIPADMKSSSIEKGSDVDDETYLKKQRRNIHALFTLFNDLSLQESTKIASEASQRIRSRTLNSGFITNLKQQYGNYEVEKKHEYPSALKEELKPIQKARKKLNSMHRLKEQLSYNPYKSMRTAQTVRNIEVSTAAPKRLQFDRKEKQYLLEACVQKFNTELACLAVIYYNCDISLIRVSRDYNKVTLEQQDQLKMQLDRDQNRNQVVEGVEFYHHRIIDCWFLLVLIRTEYNNQHRSKNRSYVRGYKIALVSNKRPEAKFAFPAKKQEFSIDLGSNEIIAIYSQPSFGFHAISHHGRYLIIRQDYAASEPSPANLWKIEHEEKFKCMRICLSCITINNKLNKALIGSIKGVLIIYDLFSHQYKLSKISINSLLQIEIEDDLAYILLSNEKIVIFDILRNQQIQVLNVKNEQRLHEKIKKFELNKGKIVCYGTAIRQFEKVIDENQQREKFQMENVYVWRLSKLKKEKGLPLANIQVPAFRKNKTYVEFIITTEIFFVLITEIQQAIFVSKQTLEVKFTIVLDIPYDAKIMKITLSPNGKLLAILLFEQSIYVFNIYTEQLFTKLKPTPFQKYTTISFLDSRNEYFMAVGTEAGKISLIPYPSVPEKPTKQLEFHRKVVCCTLLNKQILISVSEDSAVGVWQLPFNILKHEIRIPKQHRRDFLEECIGFYLDNIYFLRSIAGYIYEIDTKKGELVSVHSEFTEASLCAVDQCTGNLCTYKASGETALFQRSRKGWHNKQTIKLHLKNQVIGIGISPSEKVVFFSCEEYTYKSYQNQKASKPKRFIDAIQ